MKLASKQPREPWLADELILASAECPVNENLTRLTRLLCGLCVKTACQNAQSAEIRTGAEINSNKTPFLQSDGWKLLNNVPITHLHDAFTHGRRLRIVSDHDDGLIEAVVQLLKHVKDKS